MSLDKQVAETSDLSERFAQRRLGISYVSSILRINERSTLLSMEDTLARFVGRSSRPPSLSHSGDIGLRQRVSQDVETHGHHYAPEGSRRVRLLSQIARCNEKCSDEHEPHGMFAALGTAVHTATAQYAAASGAVEGHGAEID